VVVPMAASQDPCRGVDLQRINLVDAR